MTVRTYIAEPAPGIYLSNHASLSAADTAASGDHLIIDSDIAQAADLTVTSPVVLSGGIITPASGKTVTFSKIVTGDFTRQGFSKASGGDFAFADGQAVTPEVFGAPANGTDEDTTYIGYASDVGECVFTSGKIYRLNTYAWANNTHWRTDGEVVLKHIGDASVMVNIGNRTGCRLTGNFLFDGNTKTATGGIILHTGTNGFIHRGVVQFTAIGGAALQIDGASYKNKFDTLIPYNTGLGSANFCAISLTPDADTPSLRPYENHIELIMSKNIVGASGSGRTYVDGGDRNTVTTVKDEGTGGECVYFFGAVGGHVGASVKKGGNSVATGTKGGDTNAFELSQGCRIDSIYAEDCPGYGLSFDGNADGICKDCNVGSAVIIRPDEYGCYFTDQGKADMGPVNCRIGYLYVEDPANSTVITDDAPCLGFGGSIDCSVGWLHAKETRTTGQRANYAIYENVSASTATEFRNKVDRYTSEGSFSTDTIAVVAGKKSTFVCYNGVPTVQAYAPELAIQTLAAGAAGVISFLGLDSGGGAANDWQIGTGINLDGAFQFRTVTGNSVLLSLLKSGIIALNAPLRLDNAYTAGAPTPTGYVTIQDSNGTTYKIPAST